jgi:hypothetical protein
MERESLKSINDKVFVTTQTPIVPPDHLLLLDSAPNILDHSYIVGNLANSKIAETKALEPLKS